MSDNRDEEREAAERQAHVLLTSLRFKVVKKENPWSYSQWVHENGTRASVDRHTAWLSAGMTEVYRIRLDHSDVRWTTTRLDNRAVVEAFLAKADAAEEERRREDEADNKRKALALKAVLPLLPKSLRVKTFASIDYNHLRVTTYDSRGKWVFLLDGERKGFSVREVEFHPAAMKCSTRTVVASLFRRRK